MIVVCELLATQNIISQKLFKVYKKTNNTSHNTCIATAWGQRVCATRAGISTSVSVSVCHCISVAVCTCFSGRVLQFCKLLQLSKLQCVSVAVWQRSGRRWFFFMVAVAIVAKVSPVKRSPGFCQIFPEANQTGAVAGRFARPEPCRGHDFFRKWQCVHYSPPL